MVHPLKSVFFVLAMLVPGMASPHQGAMGAVKSRMDAMESVSDSAKTLANMQKSGLIDAAKAALAAENLLLQAEAMESLFATKDLTAPSESRPEIWDNWEDFLAKSAQMGSAAQMVGASGTDSAAFAAAVQALGQSCAACHQDYRLKK